MAILFFPPNLIFSFQVLVDKWVQQDDMTVHTSLSLSIELFTLLLYLKLMKIGVQGETCELRVNDIRINEQNNNYTDLG